MLRCLYYYCLVSFVPQVHVDFLSTQDGSAFNDDTDDLGPVYVAIEPVGPCGCIVVLSLIFILACHAVVASAHVV